MALAPADFAVGSIYYGNDNNPLSGRFQGLHFSGWTAAENLTTGTPSTTTYAFPLPAPLEICEVLDICLYYPAASGAITTPFNGVLYKTAAGTSTPAVIMVPANGGLAGAGLTIYSEASLPVNSVRKFSAATLTGATFQPNQVGLDAYSYPLLFPGDLPYILVTQAGVAGTQTAIQFGYIYRERPLYPVAPSLATSGTNTNFG